MNENLRLTTEMQTCDLHADRIAKALKELKKLAPLTVEKMRQMGTHELAITELLTARFAKLQDAIGQKIFPLLVLCLGEDIANKSFIDRLAKDLLLYWEKLKIKIYKTQL